MFNFKEKYGVSLFNDKKIIGIKNLSTSLGAFCDKIDFDDKTEIVVKGITKIDKKIDYNPIFYEGQSAKFLNKNFKSFFPNVIYLEKNLLIMDFIHNDNLKDKHWEKEFAQVVANIHNIKGKQYGYDFDPPIGGLRQPSNYQESWIEFFEKKRLGMIFELINSSNPMPKEINDDIEKILKNLKNYIPDNPSPSLLHGDLWDGNILYNKGTLAGIIDPGIYYAHNELELSYLYWFKYVGREFTNNYNDIIKINSEFWQYQEIYQLYFSLLNVHLWDREYINDAARLAKKFT